MKGRKDRREREREKEREREIHRVCSENSTLLSFEGNGKKSSCLPPVLEKGKQKIRINAWRIAGLSNC